MNKLVFCVIFGGLLSCGNCIEAMEYRSELPRIDKLISEVNAIPLIEYRIRCQPPEVEPTHIAYRMVKKFIEENKDLSLNGRLEIHRRLQKKLPAQGFHECFDGLLDIVPVDTKQPKNGRPK
jgi:hypothetical protein